MSHGGVEEGTYIGVLCVWGGVEWSVHRVRTHICTVLRIGLCVWELVHAYILHVLIITAL